MDVGKFYALVEAGRSLLATLPPCSGCPANEVAVANFMEYHKNDIHTPTRIPLIDRTALRVLCDMGLLEDLPRDLRIFHSDRWFREKRYTAIRVLVVSGDPNMPDHSNVVCNSYCFNLAYVAWSWYCILCNYFTTHTSTVETEQSKSVAMQTIRQFVATNPRYLIHAFDETVDRLLRERAEAYAEAQAEKQLTGE